MRIAIVDDEEVVRENLKTLLSMYAPECTVVVEADGVTTALKSLKENSVDLLLLDVEMKDGTGFDLLSFYGELDFEVIFVTAHDGYAIKAFKYSAIDYLLKPIDPEDLLSALKKVRKPISQNERNLKVNNLIQNKKRSQSEQKVILKDAETVFLVSLNEIIRCESETNYTKFFLVDGRKLFISKTLKEYDSLFQDQCFFRAHQSHLINLYHFDRYEKKEGGIVYMKDGSTLPVAVRKRESLMAALEKL
ncbi:LytTR family DNA-binding domain-containing protein [Reichenbachiella sp. MALMAid0571]|uniref:LytR/AlgR family response regulator transcription factor n=1 Tax=Reichenbachiella sp. MALMAid0571 TaxID=3143939 RepID=UPI0032DE5A77